MVELGVAAFSVPVDDDDSSWSRMMTGVGVSSRSRSPRRSKSIVGLGIMVARRKSKVVKGNWDRIGVKGRVATR